jgi:predicted ATPase
VPALLEASRLLTITGPGGIGKTRLALHAAAMRGRLYPDGVWLADMSLVLDGGDVLGTLATALAADQSQANPVERLLDRLRARRALIVLDNCEHVIETCAELTRSLLKNCRDLRILATSRQVLAVDGEVVCRTPPLSLPLENETSAARLRQSEAACLFLERVAAAVPAFTLRDVDVPCVADICRRLDGIPLALELAAQRVRSLGLGEVAAVVRDHKRLVNLMLADAERVLHQRLALLDRGVAKHYSARLTPASGMFLPCSRVAAPTRRSAPSLRSATRRPACTLSTFSPSWTYARERTPRSGRYGAVHLPYSAPEPGSLDA